MARRRRSFFFDNINKKLLMDTTKNTKDVKDDVDAAVVANTNVMTLADVEDKISTELSDSGYATQTYVDTEVAGIVNSAPSTLDTLDELAAALGDDANFATTTATSLGNRLRIDTNAQSLTSTQKTNAVTNLGLATVATSGAYSDLTGTPTIPTNNNQLTNGAGYITGITSSMVTTALGYTPGTSSFSGSYNDLTNKPTIPTNNNQLTNGAGYITSADGGNADTVDGIQASSFLRSDTSDTMTGELNVSRDTGASTPSYSQGMIEVQTSDNSAPAIGFHRGGYSATTLYENNGELYANAWVARSQTGKLLSTGNIGETAFTQTGTRTMNGYYVGGADGHRDKGIYGNYNSYRINNIWSMGTAYRVGTDGLGFGNLYGMAYTYHNRVYTSNTMGQYHQMVWCNNGTPYCALGRNVWTSGNVTAYSDIRVKENLEIIPNALEKVRKLNGYTFDRTDIETDNEGNAPKKRQAGVVAQEVLEVLPEVVSGNEDDPDGHLSVAYGNMVGLLIEAIKEQQEQIEELKARLQ